ncbi:hypothetical protein EC957_000599, partial [Mortierella hygrophila]
MAPAENPFISTLPSQPINTSIPFQQVERDFKRSGTGTNITRNEYCLLANLHSALIHSDTPPEVKAWLKKFGSQPRQRLSRLTGVGVNACGTAIQFVREGGVPRSLNTKPRGVKPKPVNKNLLTNIDNMVQEFNKAGNMSSTTNIRNELHNEFDIKLSRSTIRRHLKTLGYFWGKGVRRNIQHDAPQNI